MLDLKKLLNKITYNLRAPIQYRLAYQITGTFVSGKGYAVTAMTIPGYHFLGWVTYTMDGWTVAGVYSVPHAANTTFWVVAFGATNPATETTHTNLTLKCYALYIRDDLY